MRHLLLSLSLLLAACGARHEGTVTYQVHLKSGDVTGSTIAEDLHVGTDDTQWQTFLSQAQTTLNKAPAHFEVTGARIQLDATKSKNAGALQDVVSGDVMAFLRTSETGAQADVAEVKDPQGSAQVTLDPTGNSLESLDANLASSDFRLGLRGSTSKTATSDFDAVITVTLDVTAR